MKRLFVISCWLLALTFGAFAQSNLTYNLKIGTTGEVQVLTDFPESYAGEKINITIETAPLTDRNLDFVFTTEEPVEGFTEVYRFTDDKGTSWIVWRNSRKIKNRAQRTMVQNAYNTFETYLHESIEVHKSHGWIWLLFAGILLVGTAIYGCWIFYCRRKERELTPVEQETLRRKRMGLRRHYGSQVYLWLLLIVLYAPIALIAVFSFTKSKVLGNWTGFSLDLYANLFTGKADAGLNSAIWYTVVIALTAATCATILGTLAAIGI